MLATFDMSPKVLDAVADGRMLWAIDAQPYLMGYVPVTLTFNLLKQLQARPRCVTGLHVSRPVRALSRKQDALAMKALAQAGIR